MTKLEQGLSRLVRASAPKSSSGVDGTIALSPVPRIGTANDVRLSALVGLFVFVFISIASQIQVIDTSKRRVLFTWPVTSQHPGDAAFDESSSRLFIGTRTPAEMIVMDSNSGREVAHLTTAEGMDGVYFDAGRKRVYVSG
jgi:hypothetical protein